MTLRWDDFGGGHWGVLDPRKVPDNMWFGSNVRVYQDGSIGPRPGLHQASVTGNQNGVVWGLYNVPLDDKQLVVVIGTTAYRGDAGPDFTLNSLSGSLAATPETFCAFDHLNPERPVMVNPGDKCYDVNLTSSNSIAGITNSEGGYWVRIHKDRVYTSGDVDGATPWRMHYSDAGAFTTWQAANYVDVGYWYPIYNGFSIRNRLMLGRQGNGGWWSLTGTPADGTLRTVQNGFPPDRQSASVVDDEDKVWFYTQTANTKGLMVTDGANWSRKYDHLRLSGTGRPRGVFSYGNSDILFYMPDETPAAFWRTEGVWTAHEFGVQLDGPETRYGSDYMLFVGESGASAQGNYYWLDCSRQRPGFTTDAYASPGDASNTPVSASLDLSAKRAPNGGEFKPNHMLVHVTAYDWDESSTGGVGFRAWVKMWDHPDSAPVESTKVTISEDTSDFSTSGTYRTIEVPIGGDVEGAHVQPRFDQIKGLKIHAVDVFEEYAPRHGGP